MENCEDSRSSGDSPMFNAGAQSFIFKFSHDVIPSQTLTCSFSQNVVEWCFVLNASPPCHQLLASSGLGRVQGKGLIGFQSFHCKLWQCSKLLPWTKKRTIPEICGEKNTVWSCDNERSAQCKVIRDFCPALIVRYRASYQMMEQRSSHRESWKWFFFFVQGSTSHTVRRWWYLDLACGEFSI